MNEDNDLGKVPNLRGAFEEYKKMRGKHEEAGNPYVPSVATPDQQEISVADRIKMMINGEVIKAPDGSYIDTSRVVIPDRTPRVRDTDPTHPLTG